MLFEQNLIASMTQRGIQRLFAVLGVTPTWAGTPNHHYTKSATLCFTRVQATHVLCGSMDKRENTSLSIMSALRCSIAIVWNFRNWTCVNIRERTNSLVYHFLC